MPWYKVFCDFGPGHQSHHKFYHWEDKKLSKEERKEYWEEAFRDRDWPIGDMIQITRLPYDVRSRKILDVRKDLASFQKRMKEQKEKLEKFLAILEATDEGPCSHTYVKFTNDDLLCECGSIKKDGEWRKK